MEQDRHILRKKLTSKESELDARIIELENDLTEIKDKLAAKENLLKQWERDKSSLVSQSYENLTFFFFLLVHSLTNKNRIF